MVRLLVLCLFVMGSFSVGYSQTTLSFCASVEKDGFCAFDNTKFISSPDSIRARLYMLVRNPVGIGFSHLTYKLFTVDTNGKEEYQTNVEQNLQPDWIYSWQIGYFQSPGKYYVKVVNEAGTVICSKGFELFDK